jgi:hypothetical protein
VRNYKYVLLTALVVAAAFLAFAFHTAGFSRGA